VPKTAKRAALYVRVSTDHQSVDNQIQELGQIAVRRGWIVNPRTQAFLARFHSFTRTFAGTR
jgi:hypothetical protein